MALREAAEYGASGAAAGTAVMPGWGTLIGGIGGAALGFFDNRRADQEKKQKKKEREAQAREAEQQRQWAEVAQRYADYRAQAPEQRMQALSNRLGAYEGVRAAMGIMYPGVPGPDYGRMLQNPWAQQGGGVPQAPPSPYIPPPPMPPGPQQPNPANLINGMQDPRLVPFSMGGRRGVY